ncbi:MAG TPA: Maf family protein [Acidobacteriaceae bacterium]|jgi:septum formation protein|nr:Maf family protein [Acidobacteriaceae bacterium]
MLILASSSPRRRELLTQAGFSFRVMSLPVDETRHRGEDPVLYTQRLARAKAEAVFREHKFSANPKLPASREPLLVLGADTIVVCDDHILGKPDDPQDAVRMLNILSGRTHQVITGVCLISSAGVEIASETTHVTMQTLSQQEILDYIATGEPVDKAGAYAIQGRAARWVPHISGCYFNVVGLPISLVANLMEGMQAKIAATATSVGSKR